MALQVEEALQIAHSPTSPQTLRAQALEVRVYDGFLIFVFWG